jgi:RNA polymerase sigma factor (sigma-70 family)
VREKPNLNKEALTDIFLEIEDHTVYCINLLLHNTTFVEDNICYFLAEIATGLIKYRKIYRGKLVRDRVSVGCGADIGLENFRIFSTGFDLFKLSRVEREIAAPLVKRILSSLNLSPFVYENILRAFLEETETYCDLCNEAAEAASDTQRGMLEEISEIEENVGCVGKPHLYGIVKEVRRSLLRVSRLQSKVINSYQRMVLKPAREKAKNGSDAMDLFQAGTLGLSRATSMFDIDSDASFQTFAQWWIKHHVAAESKTRSQLIKLPWNVWNANSKIRAVEREFEADPDKRYVYTDADIAKALGKSETSVKKTRKRMQSVKLASFEDVRRDSDGIDSETTVETVFVNNREEDEEQLQRLRTWIRDVLQYLEPAERRLICLRFGLIDDIGENQLSSIEVVREVLRQTACRAATYLYATSD